MLRFLLFSVVVAVLCFLLQSFLPTWVDPSIWLIVGFLFILSFAGHAYIQWRLKVDAENMTTPYFLMSGVRLLGSLIFIIFFIKNSTSSIFTFVLNFFLIYFLYVGFEIYWLVTNLRRNF
ncbi:hypothetical protein [Xanthocytophaga flava]|uniref:hypothetical protein n=1 Tax=Xanthocytophaga flava TaxID=3048013 RepID=UPI0028D5AB76|nr:hypothetical protein [Xanthocytophaga flavus]